MSLNREYHSELKPQVTHDTDVWSCTVIKCNSMVHFWQGRDI